jgi:hypothetical protein
MNNSIFLERFFQTVLFLIGILSGTIFEQFQILLELFVIILLLVFIKTKITTTELWIVLAFIFVSVVSFFQNNILVFILNFKVFFIPLLLLIYYKNKIVDIVVVKFFFVLNLILILFQFIFSRYLFDISGVISLSFRDLIENRPLGLFLNFHFSSFFTAICLIYFFYYNNTFSKIGSSIFLIISGSYFTFISFILSLINKYVLFFGLILFILFYFLFSINDYLFFFPKAGSLIIILFQIFDFERYSVLSFFPQDYISINSNWHNVLNYNTYLSNNMIIENEIQYLTYFIQGGYFFALIFLIYFLKNVPSFSIFILFSMLHYGYALTPIIVFLTLVFQNKIFLKKDNVYTSN